MAYMKIVYPMTTDGVIRITTDIREEKVSEVICDYLRTQLDADADDSKPISKESYEIMLSVDLTDDTFSISHDTGNMSMVTGILRDVAAKADAGKVRYTEGGES